MVKQTDFQNTVEIKHEKNNEVIEQTKINENNSFLYYNYCGNKYLHVLNTKLEINICYIEINHSL